MRLILPEDLLPPSLEEEVNWQEVIGTCRDCQAPIEAGDHAGAITGLCLSCRNRNTYTRETMTLRGRPIVLEPLTDTSTFSIFKEVSSEDDHSKQRKAEDTKSAAVHQS